MRISPDHAIPGPEVSCMDAAEMLVDGFIKEAPFWIDPESRNELVRRVGTLLGMQREALKGEAVRDAKELAESANATWRNQQMSTQSVASRLLDLITKHATKVEG